MTRSLAMLTRGLSVLLLGAGLQIAARPAGTPSSPSRLPRTNLLVFHDSRGDVSSVRSASDWKKRRAEILDGMQAIMGPLPGDERRCPLDMRVEEEKDRGSYVQQRITYASEPGSRVPAYLLIPKAALEGDGRCRAVLALHPLDYQFGNRVIVEDVRSYYKPYGHELAERGFVVLAPLYPTIGGYRPNLKALGYVSGTMKAIWDNIRGLDLLDELPYVKHEGYGVIGHSLGGHNALFTAAFDDRLRVIVESCGFDSFLTYQGGDPEAWKPGHGWCQPLYMPKLAAYRGRLTEIPFSFRELIGSLAPRPVFINAPVRDSYFNWQGVDSVVSTAATVYHLEGVPENLRVRHPDCGHDFPDPLREEAYQLLNEGL